MQICLENDMATTQSLNDVLYEWVFKIWPCKFVSVDIKIIFYLNSYRTLILHFHHP